MYELLQVQVRDRKKDPKANRLRMAGLIPGILYARDMTPIEIKIPEADLKKCLTRCGHILEVEIQGKGKHLVNLESVQRHPLRQNILHISFHKIQKGQKTTVTLPIVLKGKAEGVKDGGIVSLQLSEIDVTGLPDDMPSEIEVEVSSLKLHGHLLLKEITPPQGITFDKDDLEKTVATCAPPRAEKVAEPTGPELVADNAEGAPDPAAAAAEASKEEEKAG